MTPALERVLAAVRAIMAERKRPPTVRDLAARLERSTATIRGSIEQLIKARLLRREGHALVVCDGGPCPYCAPPALPAEQSPAELMTSPAAPDAQLDLFGSVEAA